MAMTYYAMKKVVIAQVSAYLDNKESSTNNGSLPSESWTSFERRMLLEYGVGRSFLERILIVFGWSIINNDLVKVGL